MHCAIPLFKSAFFASTITTAGASISNCSGERLIRKSHTPLSPAFGSTVNSAPEKMLICHCRIFRTSTKIGLIINSERAFSVPVAIASGKLSSKKSERVALGAIGVISVKNRLPSRVVRPKACFTFLSVNSL